MTAASRRTIRVLEVFHTLGVGGAEVWFVALLRHIARHPERLPVDLAIDVCLTGGGPNAFDAEVAALGATLHYLPYRRGSAIAFASSYRRLLNKSRYDALHDHQDHSAGIRMAMGVGHLPSVRVVHFHNPLLMRGTYRTRLGREGLLSLGDTCVRRLATHVLGTSEQVLVEHGFGPGEVPSHLHSSALYCGFDVERFAGDPLASRATVRQEFGFDASDQVLLFVGRLNSSTDPKLNQKNPTFAIDVAAACHRRGVPIRLLMVGGGQSMKEQLEADIAARGLSAIIRMVGPRTDIPSLMLGSDALLFPSLAEGLGMVAVEAQAAGLRVIASDAVPREAVVVPELVTFASLSQGADAWATLVAEALRRPIVSASAANRLVAASRFSIARSASDLVAIYASGTSA